MRWSTESIQLSFSGMACVQVLKIVCQVTLLCHSRLPMFWMCGLVRWTLIAMRQAAVSMWWTVSSLFPMLELLIFCKIAFFSVFQIQHLWPYLLILKHMLLQSWTSCRVIDSLLMSCTVKQLSKRRKEKSQNLLLQTPKAKLDTWTSKDPNIKIPPKYTKQVYRGASSIFSLTNASQLSRIADYL